MKKKSELKQLLLLVCMMAVAFIFLVPIIWMVSASFQGQGQIFKVPFNWIPREASLKNYSFAITVGGLKDAFVLKYGYGIRVQQIPVPWQKMASAVDYDDTDDSGGVDLFPAF